MDHSKRTSGLKPIRRIVTGHSPDHIAKILRDESAPNTKFAPTGAISTLIWSTDQCPSNIAIGEDIDDGGARTLGTAPPSMGSRFSVVEFPPNTAGPLHRTETLDYVIILDGEIDMELDDSVVHMSAGDIMIQRGTNHSWVNRSAHSARVAFVLLDAKPLGIGQALGRSESAS